MGKKILVKEDINNGKKLIEELKNEKFPINGVYWEFDRELEEWKLIIITELIDKIGSIKTYSKVDNVLEKHKDEIDISLDEIKIYQPKDDYVKNLTKFIKRMPSNIKDYRISGSSIYNKYVDDIYIYNLKSE